MSNRPYKPDLMLGCNLTSLGCHALVLICCVQADEQLSQFDWDDAEGNMRRRLAGLALEKQRKEQAKLNRRERRDDMGGAVGRAKKH